MMKANKVSHLSVWALVLLLASGSAWAEEEQAGDDDQARCQIEAHEAGMTSEEDIQYYIEQCIEDMRQQSESEIDFNDDTDNRDWQ